MPSEATKSAQVNILEIININEERRLSSCRCCRNSSQSGTNVILQFLDDFPRVLIQ